jgi:pyridoxamine 5'-phosphate oxidase-like protein
MTENQPARLRPVSHDEALELLSSVPYGRIVFTERALPAVRPVNHIVDDGAVVIRTHAESAILRAAGQVVAYEADLISADSRLDWSVVVLGVAEEEENADEVARYQRLLRPMVDLAMDHVIRIRPKMVTGQLLLPQDTTSTADAATRSDTVRSTAPASNATSGVLSKSAVTPKDS